MPFKGKLGEIQSVGHALRYGNEYQRNGKRAMPDSIKIRNAPAPPTDGKLGMLYLIVKERGFILPKYAEIGSRIGLKVKGISGKFKRHKNKNGSKIKGKRGDK